MKMAICIVSHNSKDYTNYVVDSLLSQQSDVFVVDNSTIDDLKYTGSARTHYIVGANVGYGGCFDAILRSNLIDDYEFVGVFNNDLLEIPTDFCTKLHGHLSEEIGIIHPGLRDDGCPYPNMRLDPSQTIKYCTHIENVCPVYSSLVLKEYKKYTPSHYYGFIDYALSAVSIGMGLKNLVVNDTSVKHLRSAVRKSLESTTKNFSDYTSKADRTYVTWINERPDLKRMIETMKGRKLA